MHYIYVQGVDKHAFSVLIHNVMWQEVISLWTTVFKYKNKKQCHNTRILHLNNIFASRWYIQTTVNIKKYSEVVMKALLLKTSELSWLVHNKLRQAYDLLIQ